MGSEMCIRDSVDALAARRGVGEEGGEVEEVRVVGVVQDVVELGEVAAADPVPREHLEHRARVAAVLAELEKVLGGDRVRVRLELEHDAAEVVPARSNLEEAQGVVRVGFAQRGRVRDLRGLDALRPCLLYTSPSSRDLSTSRMPSSA